MAINSRTIAAQVLGRVIGKGESLTVALDETLPRIPEMRERAFVQALCFGVMRWYFRLDVLLSQLLRKPLKAMDVRVLALLGLYQIAYSRVKPHAAVAETVSALRGKPWARSLLNALLRRYLREREKLDALADASDVGRSAHPSWLLEAIGADWPERREEIVAANNAQAPMVLRLNPRRCSMGVYLAMLAEAGIDATPSELCDTALTLTSAVDVRRLPGFAEGWVSVQDAAAQFAAPLLDAKPGHRVLDVCAAPGGKTLHILETCPDLAAMVAVDIDSGRLGRVSQNLVRGGFQANLIVGDGGDPTRWWDGVPFDRILLDAPCSATGVIRRHPDIRLLRRREDIAELMRLQERILEAVWPLLRPGGQLVYATCSILRCENEKRIMKFLEAHDDAVELAVDIPLGTSGGAGRQICTGEGGMDGFFYARLSKKGG